MKLKMIIVFFVIFGLRPALYGQGFPNKPIELIVSSSPGGGIDLIFRLVAEELAKT
jgi:tripartite-type tricarboxylate transporter receptor subunit TctC